MVTTVSADIYGRLDAPRDRARQTRRNPWRCQRRRVSGWTMRGVARQEDEVEPIGGGARGPHDLAGEDHELLAQEGVLGDQRGLHPGQIADGTPAARPVHSV